MTVIRLPVGYQWMFGNVLWSSSEKILTNGASAIGVQEESGNILAMAMKGKKEAVGASGLYQVLPAAFLYVKMGDCCVLEFVMD